MRKLTATLCLTLAVLLGSVGMSASADFQKGADAYQSGDYLTALREWKPLAEQGNVRAQNKLGVMYRRGIGVPLNYKTAIKWYKLAAEQGYAIAQSKLGTMYAEGRGVPQNDKTAVKWYRLAAEQGWRDAQVKLDQLERQDQLKRQRMSASADFQKGRNAYKTGDYATALREWKPLAKQGNASAQFNLGLMYRNGEGVPQDYKTAVKWFKIAVEQRYANAQFNLGVMYENGQGVPKNYMIAATWYELAAEQGNASAQTSLGWMYEEGVGVPKNNKTAVKWYRLAAEQGDADAQEQLGLKYELLGSDEKYKVLGLMWLFVATENGKEKAISFIKRQTLRFTKSNRYVLAEKMAKTCISKNYKNCEVIPKTSEPSPPPISISEKEIETLRKENARLKKQNQSKPKQVAERPEPKPDLALAKRTQEALQVLEIYSGKIDGIIGVKTRLAIRGWQTRNGYPATGAIDQTQIAKLEESAIQYLTEKKSKPKQVAKRPQPKKSPPPSSGSTGSGFFVSKLGHIVTNEHVVRQCGSVTVGDNANKQVAASVLETDRRNDLALLRISSTQMASAETKSLISKLGLKLVPLASEGLFKSDDVELGEDVLVAGYPYGELFSNSIKVTKGIVSSNKGMGDDRGQFQMDAAVQPGNSGGPIYDENGNIVGVVISQLNKLKVAKAIGSLPENVNFGIKASTVRQFLTSAGLPTKWSNRTERKSTKELAQIAKNQTVMVVCNP
jgi:uncharacterized protein